LTEHKAPCWFWTI